MSSQIGGIVNGQLFPLRNRFRKAVDQSQGYSQQNHAHGFASLLKWKHIIVDLDSPRVTVRNP